MGGRVRVRRKMGTKRKRRAEMRECSHMEDAQRHSPLVTARGPVLSDKGLLLYKNTNRIFIYFILFYFRCRSIRRISKNIKDKFAYN